MKRLLFLYGFTFCSAFDLKAQMVNLIYTANQNSNSVSVVDADRQEVLGAIVLGHPSTHPSIFHPLYNGEVNVHGINYDPVNKKIAVVSTTSNSVVLIDAAMAEIERKAYVGRNPHEPRFTKDGRELWVTVRGENYVVILDAKSLIEKARVVLSEGPGMVAFSNDGKTAYVSSSFDNNFWIIETSTRKIIRTLKMPSQFSPFVNSTNDGDEVWVTHKDVGMVTRIDTKSNTIIESFKTGAITNHIAFSDSLAFVTAGGENKIKVYPILKGKRLSAIKEIPTDNLPHGIWYHRMRNEVYVASELSNTLQVVDVKKKEITKTLKIGERPQALIPVTVAASLKRIEQSLQTPIKFKGPQN
jgi:DNA-binding beta-propeller fold protein YncE